MADPFSIIAGTVGVADVCFRVARYLKNAQAAAARVGDEISSLLDEIKSLETVNASVKRAYDAEFSEVAGSSSPREKNLQNLWEQTGLSLSDCQLIVDKLHDLVKDIYGKHGESVVGKLDGLGKQSRRQSKAPELQHLRSQLSTCQNRVQILITGISMYRPSSLLVTELTLISIGAGVGSRIESLEISIHSSNANNIQGELDRADLIVLKKLRASVESISAAVRDMHRNEHFDTPQSVSSFYTGREVALLELQRIMFASNVMRQQKRFVIQGLGGSGKTQFCCKFAQDNRDSFWGVYWIDASSDHQIRQTFAQHVSSYGKVEPNENAALHWLSNLDRPWLLIIDNADDASINLEKCFPPGDRGYILITTRNPANKVYGNVGPGFFEFHSLDQNDANELLLRAAQRPRPWDIDTSKLAAKITRQLGFLALALAQAGAAIRSGLCTLKNYLQFYDENWRRIRRARSPSRDSGEGNEDYMNVYTCYDVCYAGLEKKGTESSRDAIQLLKTFAFLYFENVRSDILLKAATNKQVEARIEKEDRAMEASQPSSWNKPLRSFKNSILLFVMKSRGPAALPHVIRDARESGDFDNLRLQYALRELVQTSMVMYNEKTDSYTLHPLIHKWARERPGMTTAEQALWAQVAGITLAHSILLPPAASTEEDERFRRDLLPHVDHVLGCMRILRQRMVKSRESRWLPCFSLEPSFDREQAILSAKFSIVYAQGGRWQDAETLQVAVKDYTQRVLGIEHRATRRITLVLADTLWYLGRGDEAAELQSAILDACIRLLGREDHETLMAMDNLAKTRWQQGRYSDALTIQEEAVTGLTKVRGPEHQDTLTAMDRLGQTITKLSEDMSRAEDLHQKAATGMKKVLGLSHSNTLIAMENLAMVKLQMESELERASQIMDEVFELRKENLGKEHPYTLLAMANLARLKSATGYHSEAEDLIRTGIPIAQRNLGTDHIGTLMGRQVLGSILIRQSRFNEAENELLDICERQKHLSFFRGDTHPDRIGTMIHLVDCYRLQGRYNECLRYCDEVIDGLTKISIREHPITRRMKKQKETLIGLQANQNKTVEVLSQPTGHMAAAFVKNPTW